MRHIIKHGESLAFEIRREDYTEIAWDKLLRKTIFYPADESEYIYAEYYDNSWENEADKAFWWRGVISPYEQKTDKNGHKVMWYSVASRKVATSINIYALIIPIELEDWEVFEKGKCEPEHYPHRIQLLQLRGDKSNSYTGIAGSTGCHEDLVGSNTKLSIFLDGNLDNSNIEQWAAFRNGDLFRKAPEYRNELNNEPKEHILGSSLKPGFKL